MELAAICYDDSAEEKIRAAGLLEIVKCILMGEKIEKIRKMIEKTGKNIDLEVDGGINNITAKDVKNAGANVLVSGSYIFNSKNYKEAIESLK